MDLEKKEDLERKEKESKKPMVFEEEFYETFLSYSNYVSFF